MEILVLKAVLLDLIVGAIHGLIGASLNLLYGVLRVVNFAYGEFVVAGVCLAFTRLHVLESGLGFHVMGVKKKTFERLRDFRAGVESNISELMRAYGMAKATWKHRDGFIAYVWSCALSYNVMRMAPLGYG